MLKIADVSRKAAIGLKSYSPLGNWAWITFYLIFAIVMYSDSSRWLSVIGEKNIPSWGPGQNDFSYPYTGARAILAGVNPYRNNLPEFTSRIFGITKIDG